MTAREAFLQRVREAVAAGNQAGQKCELPVGPRIGYQGGGANPVRRFADELQAAGGRCHIVANDREATRQIVQVVLNAGARRAVLGQSELLARLDFPAALRSHGLDVWQENQPTEPAKDALFAADVGITGVDWLVAETGSIVLASRPGQARSLSLLPPLHIAVAERAQLIPDLFDLFDNALIAPTPRRPDAPSPPSCLTIITGPSKTGDIELRLVTGVHGPGEVHVVLIDS
jgi:L-lactate dehydrogenase complex protein LldG